MYAVLCLSDGKIWWYAQDLVTQGLKVQSSIRQAALTKAKEYATSNPGKVYHAVRLIGKLVQTETGLDEFLY